MDFPKILDVYQLSDRAANDYSVSEAKNPNTSLREMNEVHSTLSSMRAALDSFGFVRVAFEDIADRWTEIAEDFGATLFRDDVVEGYWKERLVVSENMTRESMRFLEGHVDWMKLAVEKGARKISFVYASFPSERTYWLLPSI